MCAFYLQTWSEPDIVLFKLSLTSNGELAQMVERPLCMREVSGSMLKFPNFFFFVTSLILVDIILFAPIDSNSLSQLFLCYQERNRKTIPFKSEKQIGKGML